MQASDQGVQSPIPASAAAAADLGQPDRETVRRRLVQTTLFPLKTGETKEEDCDRVDVESCAEVEDGRDEDEEHCGSQGKRKRKQGKQQNSQPQRSKKVFSTGRKTPTKHTVQCDSPDRGEESPQNLKEKQMISRRNGRINDMKGPCLEKVPTCPVEQVQVSLPTPDLRLEAKLSAEENSHLYVGKKMHPFFTKWKVGKCNEVNSDPKSNCRIAGGKNKNFKFGPIHVFEDVKDYVGSMDWSNWNFYDGTFSNTTCKETATTSFFGDFVGSLCFNQIYEGVSPPGDLTEMEVDTITGKPGFISHDVGYISSHGETNTLIGERMKSYYLGCCSQSENSLWTCKYRPEKTNQVCGNSESVKTINVWLQQWRKRYQRTTKNCPQSPSGSLQEVDDLSDRDCDSDYMEEAPVLKNVMLVTGPVGSGKSAAIYACAKEQGFQVIEVNASDWRNGALVKKKFRNAVESHCLKGRQETSLGSQSKLFVKPSALSRGAVTEELRKGVIELISLSGDENSTETEIQKKFDYGDVAIDSSHGEIGTLILFEEVDATLYEDSGLISAIHLLANTGKRPMILTANSENLILPHNLVREKVLFTKPSLRELLLHVNMICAAEKAEIQTLVIERYIHHCKCDIRKLIMQLQFWCQGNGVKKDMKLKKSYRPPLFDLDAGHSVMPKLFPLDVPSQLSEAVEREITKSLSRMTGNNSLFMVPMDTTNNSLLENDLNGLEGVTISSMEAKKQVILRRNCFSDDNQDLIAPVVTSCEFSDSSGSPVAFSRRIFQEKAGTVLSYVSEDEVSDENLISVPGQCAKVCGDESICKVDYDLLTNHPILDDSLHLYHESIHNDEEAGMETQQQCSKRMIDGQCQSVDISCVPESTVVPETELDDGMELPSTADQTEAISQVMVGDSNQVTFAPEEVTKRAMILDLNVPYDEIGGSYIEKEDSATCARAYQVMDECSRMDFCRGAKRLNKSSSISVFNSVQETWNELRLSDLKEYGALEHKDASQVVELACRMSNLISEADMLLCHYQSPSSGNLEEQMDVTEEAFCDSWHSQHVRMVSDIAEHGYCLHAKEAAALVSNMGMENSVDLAGEMLASVSKAMELGKFLRLDRSQTSFARSRLKEAASITSLSFQSERETALRNIFQSIVPCGLHLAVKGNGYHEYLSSLAQISRSEALRLSKVTEKTRQRRKIAKSHLIIAGLILSPDDISVLNKHDCYGKSADVEL